MNGYKKEETLRLGTSLRIVSVTRRPLRERTVWSSTFRRFSSSRISKFFGMNGRYKGKRVEDAIGSE